MNSVMRNLLLFGAPPAVAAAWQNNGTWSAADVPFSNTPTLGAELLTNPTFDANTTGWSATNSTLASVAGGQSNNALQVTNTGATSGQASSAAATTVAGDYVLGTVYHKNGLTTGRTVLSSTVSLGDLGSITGISDAGVWAQKFITGRASNTTTFFRLLNVSSVTSDTTLWDEASFKKLTTINQLFNVRAGVSLPASVLATGTITPGCWCGVVYGLDSISNPQNLIQAVHDGVTGIRLEKLVAGAWTTVLTTTATYVAGVLPEVRWISANTFGLFYNNVQRGANQTISDAGTGLLHGVISTYSGNVITGVTVS